MAIADGEWEPLIRHAIRLEGVPLYLQDEAYSEGLVVAVEASYTYKPERATETTWVVQNVRWAIRTLLGREKRSADHLSWSDVYSGTVKGPESLVDFIRASDEMEKLPHGERGIIMGLFLGYTQTELAKRTGVPQQRISEIRQSFSRKLAVD